MREGEREKEGGGEKGRGKEEERRGAKERKTYFESCIWVVDLDFLGLFRAGGAVNVVYRILVWEGSVDG